MKRHEPKGNKWLSICEEEIVDQVLDLDARAGAIGDWSTVGPHQEDIPRCGTENQSEFKSQQIETSACFVKVPVYRHNCQESLAEHMIDRDIS